MTLFQNSDSTILSYHIFTLTIGYYHILLREVFTMAVIRQ